MAVKQLTINGTSWLTFRDVLRALEPFRTYGNLRGERDTFHEGRMPEPFRSVYHERREFIDYTVLSYATPIAWHDIEHGWVMPDVGYSVTTSKAQGRIAPAVAALNAERDERIGDARLVSALS